MTIKDENGNVKKPDIDLSINTDTGTVTIPINTYIETLRKLGYCVGFIEGLLFWKYSISPEGLQVMFEEKVKSALEELRK